MRLPHSLKSTHWVVWSSPVLLLVLVFTWTASSSSTPAHHLDALSVTPPTTHSTSASRTPPTTISVTTTTTPVTRAKVRTTVRRTAPTKAPIVAARPTSVVRVKSSSSATDSNAKSNANVSAANASSGVVSGQLSPTFAVADVPLRGPGTWEVATSAPASVTLTCAGTAITVNEEFVIAAHTTCQVTITAEAPNYLVTWELTPTN